MKNTETKKNSVILFKYGGNAMLNEALQQKVLKNICSLKSKGKDVVIVHGGGPFIKEALETAKIESDFIDGQRVTTPEAYEHVEATLKGRVNGKLVSQINALGCKAVGLSGKDGKIVTAKKRLHIGQTGENKGKEIDLGRVGDIESVNPELLNLLLENDFLPVITCIASDEQGTDYNINGDIFAGYIAGAVKAERYVILTDVDGLLHDKFDENSLIPKIKVNEIKRLTENKTIQSGMIPKTESCKTALETGALAAQIINGTKPEQIAQITDEKTIGTLITK
jgi:acetylglutamate kinase